MEQGISGSGVSGELMDTITRITSTVDPMLPADVHNYPQTQTGDGISFNVNLTSVDDIYRLGTDTNFLTFLFSLVCGFVWVLYITFYSSRIIALVVTKVVNRFIKEGYLNVGSISLSVLSGKVMFRDVSYVTEDCSIRIQDGWVIFRWWRAYVPKDISEGIVIINSSVSLGSLPSPEPNSVYFSLQFKQICHIRTLDYRFF